MFLQAIQSFENIISKALHHIITERFFGEAPLVPESRPASLPTFHGSFEQTNGRLSASRAAIREHSVFSLIRGIEDLRTFTSFHAFSVWQHLHLLEEFQIILRRVQRTRALPGVALGLRLVNEMLLEKETELTSEILVSSHFDLYLEAMSQLGVSHSYVSTLEQLRRFSSDHRALREISLPRPVRACLETHLQILESGSLLKIAGFLFLGRESGCGKSFLATVEALSELYPEKLAPLISYLNLYRGSAAQEKRMLSRRFLESLCGEDSEKWSSVTQAAELALHSRMLLWDGACEEILRREVSRSHSSNGG